MQSAPTINGRITGSFTNEEVQNLSLILRSGVLAVPVTLIEERTVKEHLNVTAQRRCGAGKFDRASRERRTSVVFVAPAKSVKVKK